MNVAYSINKKTEEFFILLKMSVLSLCEKNKGNDLTIFVVYKNLDAKDRKELKEITDKHGVKIKFIRFPEDKYKKELSIFEKFTGLQIDVSSFYRLFLGELLPKRIDRVLYLDCDTLINRNLRELFDIKTDKGLITTPNQMNFKDFFSSVFKDYFCAGTILINLQKVGKNLLNDSIDVAKKYDGLFQNNDEDILNFLFERDKKSVPQRYFYVVTWMNRKIPLNEIFILHYGGLSNPKQVHLSCKKYRDLFNKYYKIVTGRERELPPYKFHFTLIKFLPFWLRRFLLHCKYNLMPAEPKSRSLLLPPR